MAHEFHTAADWPPLALPLHVTNDVVHVIRVRLDLPPERWNAMRPMLAPDELIRADRFRFDEPRQRFIICRSTLRRILGSCFELPAVSVPLEYHVQGKPRLGFEQSPSGDARIEFSVSHSGNLGLIAVTSGSVVGIDIEEHNPRVNTQGLAKRYFSTHENEQLSRLPSELHLPGFYRGWTCKEAYIKAIARGLSFPLDSFAVMIDPREPAQLLHVDDQPEEPACWAVQSLDLGAQYSGAVMVKRPGCQVECWNWVTE